MCHVNQNERVRKTGCRLLQRCARMPAVVALSVVSMMVFPTAAVSQPLELTRDNIIRVSAQAWQDGPGQTTDLEVVRLQNAADAVPSRWSDLTITTSPELGVSGVGPLGDWMTAATVGIDLGSQPSLLQQAFEARAAATGARAEVAKFEWTADVSALWVDVAIRQAMASHLREYRDEVESQLTPFRQAAAAKTLAKTDLADLEVELARLETELALIEKQASEGRAHLAYMLGEPVDVVPPALPEPEGPTPGNPWDGNLPLDSHPLTEALVAEVRADQLDAAAAASAAPLHIDAGVAVHRDPEGEIWMGPTVSFTVPLRNQDAPSRALSEGQEAVDREQSRWRFILLQREIERNRADFETLVQTW